MRRAIHFQSMRVLFPGAGQNGFYHAGNHSTFGARLRLHERVLSVGTAMLMGASCGIMARWIPLLLLCILPLTGFKDLSQHKLHAAAIWKRYKSGAVQFVNPTRDKPQIQEASRTG